MISVDVINRKIAEKGGFAREFSTFEHWNRDALVRNWKESGKGDDQFLLSFFRAKCFILKENITGMGLLKRCAY
jgi:hypothetical protein